MNRRVQKGRLSYMNINSNIIYDIPPPTDKYYNNQG